ncbi:receptor-like protein 12 [Tanacetum coccineum]
MKTQVYLQIFLISFLPDSFDSSLSTKLLEAECQRLLLMGRCHLQHQGSGHIPEELLQLTRLKVLDLSSLFSYGIRSLKLKNPSLATTCLQAHTAKGSLYGQFPLDESLQKLQSLSVIRLHLNDLSALVLDFFANFKNLTILNLVRNLIGTFPKNLLRLQKLQSLDLSVNTNLTSSLPEFPVNRALQSLEISRTNFYGEMPESIGNLKNFLRIELYSSNFSGTIPKSMEKLTCLSYIDLSSNRLTGQIPSFQFCKSLAHIDLSRNSLSDEKIEGEIPNWIWEVGNGGLSFMNLSRNNLTSLQEPYSIPSFISILDLHSNRLSGAIPIPP